MLAFAKDITKNDPTHPEESNNPRLKSYMDYQRRLNHELFVYHSLEHTKTYLQKNIEDGRGDDKKLKRYVEKAFPFAHRFADGNMLMLMLRKLINGHNSSNNWYRMNAFYYTLVYDSMERFCKVHNRLVREAPEKARDYNIADGMEIDFDDWVQLFFPDLDFLVGEKPRYPHYTFSRRNAAISSAIERAMKTGKSRADALAEIREEYDIDASSIKVILGQRMEEKDLELFYTSAENPIYEYLYQSAEMGFGDEETLIDHLYFLCFQLKGLSEPEAEAVMKKLSKTRKN
ncbi:MAG: hypothetical protein ACE5G9_02770 [Nitrospinales bacterium]